jgi:hypothetical protein
VERETELSPDGAGSEAVSNVYPGPKHNTPSGMPCYLVKRRCGTAAMIVNASFKPDDVDTLAVL